MNIIAIAVLVAALLGMSAASLAEGEGTIVAESPEFWKLVPKDAKIEKIAGDFQFLEGPLWHKDRKSVV